MAKQKSGEVRILVTGGGTGGHVSPALAVIQAVKEAAMAEGESPIFRYIGSHDGVERRLATEAGLDFVDVQSGKLRRAFNLRGYWKVFYASLQRLLTWE